MGAAVPSAGGELMERSLEAVLHENHELREEITRLKAKLDYLTTHRTVAAGIAGEKIVSELIGGTMSAYAAGFDVKTYNGRLIEVKQSRGCRSVAGYPSLRWQWAKVFGERGTKSYDYLLLIGDVDARYQHLYRDRNAPYVFFCVPFVDVAALTRQGTRDSQMITLSTNPKGVRTDAGKKFYSDHQITIGELKSRFGPM